MHPTKRFIYYEIQLDIYGMCDRDIFPKPALFSATRRAGVRIIAGGITLKDKNTVSVSLLPDDFVEWTTHMSESGARVPRATLLRQHLLEIPEYLEWRKNRTEE